MLKNVRKVIITGGVAIGKTTIINNLIKLFGEDKIIVVHEYIDALDNGCEMLNKYLNKEISSYEFQLFILKYYENTLRDLRDKDLTNKIIIFERTLDDSITCFSNRDHRIGRLTTEEFYELYQIAKRIDNDYYLPSWIQSDNEYVFIPIKSRDSTKDSNIIKSIIENKEHYTNIIIGLYNTPQECYNRVQKRNRKGENVYTLEWISDFNYNYQKLYESLMNGNYIDITGMDKLLR